MAGQSNHQSGPRGVSRSLGDDSVAGRLSLIIGRANRESR
jgi:hypothetical protein